MTKEIFKNLPDTSTPLSASKLNGLFDGEESMGSIVVEDVKCKNLFDTTKYNSTSNINVLKNTNGTLEFQGITGYYAQMSKSFEVIPNQIYTLSYIATRIDTSTDSQVLVEIKDNDDSTVLKGNGSSGNQKITFTPTHDKIFINFRVNGTTNTGHSKWENIQLEPGSVATNYVPHKNFENKGVVYDDEERVIGTWWGQLLYRKVIEFGTLPNNGTKNVSHYISNVHYFTKIRGFAYQTNGTYNVPIPFKEGNVEISISANDVNTFIKTFDDRTGWYAFVILEYIKDN